MNYGIFLVFSPSDSFGSEQKKNKLFTGSSPSLRLGDTEGETEQTCFWCWDLWEL